MRFDDLIVRLSQIRSEYGDIPVVAFGYDEELHEVTSVEAVRAREAQVDDWRHRPNLTGMAAVISAVSPNAEDRPAR